MSTIRIQNNEIFFTAIESMSCDAEDKVVIIRTVSGKEYTRPVESIEQANLIIAKIITTKAVHDNI